MARTARERHPGDQHGEPRLRELDPSYPARGGVVGWAAGALAGVLYGLVGLQLDPAEALAAYALGATGGATLGALAGAAYGVDVRAADPDRRRWPGGRLRHRH